MKINVFFFIDNTTLIDISHLIKYFKFTFFISLYKKFLIYFYISLHVFYYFRNIFIKIFINLISFCIKNIKNLIPDYIAFYNHIYYSIRKSKIDTSIFSKTINFTEFKLRTNLPKRHYVRFYNQNNIFNFSLRENFNFFLLKEGNFYKKYCCIGFAEIQPKRFITKGIM